MCSGQRETAATATSSSETATSTSSSATATARGWQVGYRTLERMKYTSPNRPDTYPGASNQYQDVNFKGNNGMSVGTGSSCDAAGMNNRLSPSCPCHFCKESGVEEEVDCVVVVVMTATHVVYDDSEVASFPIVFKIFGVEPRNCVPKAKITGRDELERWCDATKCATRVRELLKKLYDVPHPLKGHLSSRLPVPSNPNNHRLASDVTQHIDSSSSQSDQECSIKSDEGWCEKSGLTPIPPCVEYVTTATSTITPPGNIDHVCGWGNDGSKEWVTLPDYTLPPTTTFTLPNGTLLPPRSIDDYGWFSAVSTRSSKPLDGAYHHRGGQGITETLRLVLPVLVLVISWCLLVSTQSPDQAGRQEAWDLFPTIGQVQGQIQRFHSSDSHCNHYQNTNNTTTVISNKNSNNISNNSINNISNSINNKSNSENNSEYSNWNSSNCSDDNSSNNDHNNDDDNDDDNNNDDYIRIDINLEKINNGGFVTTENNLKRAPLSGNSNERADDDILSERTENGTVVDEASLCQRSYTVEAVKVLISHLSNHFVLCFDLIHSKMTGPLPSIDVPATKFTERRRNSCHHLDIDAFCETLAKVNLNLFKHSIMTGPLTPIDQPVAKFTERRRNPCHQLDIDAFCETLAKVNLNLFSNDSCALQRKRSATYTGINLFVADLNFKQRCTTHNPISSFLYNFVIIMCIVFCVLVCFARLPGYGDGIIPLKEFQFPWISPSVPTLPIDKWKARMMIDFEMVCLKTREGFKSDWMKNANNIIPDAWSRITHFVYPITSAMERVASFSGFHNPSHISLLKLSQYGFYYSGVGETLRCSDCASIVDAKNIVSAPSDKQYHAHASCQFAQTGDEEPGSACSIDEQAANASTKHNRSEDGAAGFLKDLGNSTEFQEEAEDKSSLLMDEVDGATPGKESFKFYDHNAFIFQCAIAKDEVPFQCPNPVPHNDSPCTRNENSFTMVSPKEVTREHLPLELSSADEILSIVKLASELTVKINVPNRSPYRQVKKSNRGRLGTGSAFLDCTDESETWLTQMRDRNELNAEQRNRWRKGKKISAESPTNQEDKVYYYFSIMTNRHVVFDQYEASNVKIELFYESENTEGVKVVEGFAVKSSPVEGDYKCYLICRTSKRIVIDRILAARQQLNYHVDSLPRSLKEHLTNVCLVVLHPHGLSKRISFGKTAVAKYGLTEDKERKTKKMFHCSNKASLPRLEDTREVLLYNAPTCRGSSGSPVFTFRKTGQDEDGRDVIELSLWIHNGLEASTKLGGSIMRCIDPDVPNSGDPVPLSTLQSKINTEIKPEGASPSTNDAVSGSTPSAPKKGVPPLYPDFYHWEKRVSSYKVDNYRSRCDHSPIELALGGFFFTGKDDCVRCFYCGLGLKAWRSGDNMYVEHQKSRPSCGFLKICLEWKGDLNLGLLGEETIPQTKMVKNAPPSVVVGLLTRENMMLKQQQLCKMCFRHPRRELFLPCAEVNTCEECAGILSVCPSCNKKIEATATIYMS